MTTGLDIVGTDIDTGREVQSSQNKSLSQVASPYVSDYKESLNQKVEQIEEECLSGNGNNTKKRRLLKQKLRKLFQEEMQEQDFLGKMESAVDANDYTQGLITYYKYTSLQELMITLIEQKHFGNAILKKNKELMHKMSSGLGIDDTREMGSSHVDMILSL